MSNDGDSLICKETFSEDGNLSEVEEDKGPLTLSIHLSGGQFKGISKHFCV